jgi:O-antigen/teichoic acid export membrane protein
MIKKLWNSATIMTWMRLVTDSSRLIIVTPLLLHSFNEVELAAWYMFASLNIVGLIISQRLGLTFSRMISFAMGGASQLGPISNVIERNRTIKAVGVNWNLLANAYVTFKSLQLMVTLAASLIAILLGYYGLGSLTKGYAGAVEIWQAFSIFLVTQSISFAFERYAITLNGMGYVALVQRWNAIFNVLSVAAGAIALISDLGIVYVALAMQSVTLFTVVRNFLILRYVNGGAAKTLAKDGRFTKEILDSAWPPLWKGFIGQISIMGLIQLSGIIYAQFADAASVASYLFALRILKIMESFTDAPLQSQQPRMSRMVAKGETEKLRGIFYQRMPLSIILFITGAVAVAILGEWILNQLGASINFLDVNVWMLLVLMTALRKIQQLHLALLAAGNHVLYYWDALVSCVLSLGLMYWAIPLWGVGGMIFALFLPYLLIINIRPIRAAQGYLR